MIKVVGLSGVEGFGMDSKKLGEFLRSRYPDVPPVADLVKVCGSRVPVASVAAVLVAAGVDELPAHNAEFEAFKKVQIGCSQDVNVAWVALKCRSLLWAADGQSRLRAAMSKAGNATVVVLNRTDGKQSLVVHPSTRERGRWQLTRMDERGPSGHVDFGSREEAIASAIGWHPKGHLYNEGGVDFMVFHTEG